MRRSIAAGTGAALRRVWLIVLVAAVVPPASAEGGDASANFLVKLFMEVCIPDVGTPQKVRAWAEEHHLQEVTNPIALDVFVGPGDKGAAWAVPASVGSFALSIRGRTEACAVWARAANPPDVETLFRTIVEGASRPGVDVRVVKDTRDQSPSGVVHSLVYSVSGTDKQRGGFMYIMQTAERPGGPFQASLKSARYVGAIDDAVRF
jgi:hypothetical protein